MVLFHLRVYRIGEWAGMIAGGEQVKDLLAGNYDQFKDKILIFWYTNYS